jgi:hypothetical protein
LKASTGDCLAVFKIRRCLPSTNLGISEEKEAWQEGHEEGVGAYTEAPVGRPGGELDITNGTHPEMMYIRNRCLARVFARVSGDL